MNDSHTKLIPLGAMAQRLRVAAKWLREEAEAGRIPHLAAGARILVDPDAVERVLVKRAKRVDGGKNDA